jgi:hypothetical protein
LALCFSLSGFWQELPTHLPDWLLPRADAVQQLSAWDHPLIGDSVSKTASCIPELIVIDCIIKYCCRHRPAADEWSRRSPAKMCSISAPVTSW